MVQQQQLAGAWALPKLDWVSIQRTWKRGLARSSACLDKSLE
jgi:hypothetical protein